MLDMEYDQISQPSDHSDSESVPSAVSDLHVYIYRMNNSNSILAHENMSIGTKIDFLSQSLTRQSTRRARTSLAEADLA